MIRLALQLTSPIRPIDVEHHFDVNHRTALRLLQSLCTKGWLRPVSRGNAGKVLRYELDRRAWDYID